MAKDLNGKELPKGICQLKDGRYMAQFTFCGKRYALCERNLKDVKKKLADMRYEVEHGLYAKQDNITASSWFKTWLREYKEPSVKQGTIDVYRNSFKLYLNDSIGNRKLKDIRPEHIQTIYNDLHDKSYSKSTIEVASIVLSGMFKQAIKNRIIRENPVPLASLPRYFEVKEPKVMSVIQQKTFTDYADSSHLKELFITALGTGMRSGELRGLEWKNVDFDRKKIYIRRTLLYLNKDYVLGEPKTKSSRRDVPMLDSICTLLKEHKENQDKIKRQLGDQWKPKEGFEDLAFTSETGYPINRDVLRQEMNRIIQAINKDGIFFDHFTPHSLRHTMATRCLEKSMTPKVLQTILGHSKLSTTMDLYVHVMPDTKDKEIQCISDYFN